MFYYNHKYQFTTHAVYRIKERIKLKSKEEFALKDEIVDLIESSVYEFEDEKYVYKRYKNTEIYFVIEKMNSTIITATPIGSSKMLKILEGNR